MLRKYINKRVNKQSSTTKAHQIDTITFKNNGETQDLNISRNAPCVIAGKKGSGKTSFINGLIDGCYDNKIFVNVIYIYINSIDDNLNENVTRCNVKDAEELLTKFFEIKNRFNSCAKFIKTFNESTLLKRELTLHDFFENYIDNTLEEIATELSMTDNKAILLKDLIAYAIEFIKIHVKPFIIAIDSRKFNFRPLDYDTNDLIVIDDIAIAAPILFKSQRTNQIYKYFTLTRHLNVCIMLACQELIQVPKMIRHEIDTWLVSKNTNVDLLEDIISSKNLMLLQNAQTKLKQYEFACLNLTENKIIII